MGCVSKCLEREAKCLRVSNRIEIGGPTLFWSSSQRLLHAAIGDVLIILDCCNAALVEKGLKDGRKRYGRLEMIAASAKGVKTPYPGKRSFTTILMKEVKAHIENGITAKTLHGLVLESILSTGKYYPIH
jgi:hypothetical protein